MYESSTMINVGERVQISCGPDEYHAGRVWQAYFDGIKVKHLVDIMLDGPLDGIGQKMISMRRISGQIEPDAVFMSYMKDKGWRVVFVAHTQEDLDKGEIEITDRQSWAREWARAN